MRWIGRTLLFIAVLFFTNFIAAIVMGGFSRGANSCHLVVLQADKKEE